MNERLVDILLLNIIEAYGPANATATREERLAQAKQALFGIKQDVGREPVNDDKAMLSIVRVALKDNAPTLTHELLSANARLKGEAYEGEEPQPAKLKSLRATIIAAIKDDETPLASKHSDEAAYRRLKRKIEKGQYTLGDVEEIEEIEEIEEGTLAELDTIEQIQKLLKNLGVASVHKGSN